MAGQEIIFQFLSRGSAQLASDFRKVGDDAALGSRGVKVLQGIIESLGAKADRTAAESKVLAGALRQTGEAADRATAKAVLADAAIRRLGDDMKAVKPADVVVLTDKARAKLDGIKAKAEELRAKFPQFAVQIDDKLAKAELDLFAADAKRKLKATLDVKVDEPALTRLKTILGGLKINPGLAGPITALIPAVGVLTGVVAGAGIGLAGAFVAGGAALASFGAVAKPVLTDAKTAATAVEKAQNNYSIAIANGTKQSVAFKAEQIAIAKAYANLSPAQIQLSKQLGTMAQAWDAVKTAQTPLVAGALQPWLKSVSDLTGKLAPIIAAVSPVIKALGVQFDALVNSAAFKGFRDFIAGTGSRVVGAAGGTIIDLVKSFMLLLPKFNPLILQMTGGIAAIGPAVLKWASSQKTADQITAFMGWFTRNGPVVGGLLTNIAGALKALAPGLTTGGALELKLISDFFGLVAKLPPAFAKPITEVAGSLLILSKLGVLKVGVQIVGAAAKWLTGGLINIGGGAAAGAEAGAAIRTAMVSGGAAAAAEIRAAMAGGGAAAGAAGSEGAAAGAAAQIKSKLPALLVPVASALAPIINGLLLGLLARGIGDTLSPKGTFAGRLNASLQGLAQTSGGIFSTNLLHSFTFGGLEAWLTAKIGLPVGKVLNDIAAGAKIWGGNLTQGVTGTFSNIAGGAKTWWGNITGTVSGAWRTITGQSTAGGAAVARAFGAAGAAADALRTRNLVPLLGTTGQVSGGIQGLAGMITGRGVSAFTAMGTAATNVRTGSLVPLGVGVDTTAGKVGNLSKYLLAVPKKVSSTVAVNFVGSGSGSIAFKESIPGVTVGPSSTGLLGFHAAGGLIRGGVPGKDSVLGWLMPGEVVVPASMVKAGAVDHLRGKLPEFAAGGIVSDYAGMLKAGHPFMSNTEASFGRAVEDAFARAVIAKFKKDLAAAQAAAAAKAGGGVSGAGPTGGDAATNLALARKMFPWPASQWPAFNTLEMHEAGYDRFARNSSSGAYGIPQAYPPTKMPFAAQAAGGSHAGPQLSWMFSYIRSVYGTPGAAWAQYYNHAGGQGSYDRGGWLMPGVTVAVNNTGRPELVSPGEGFDKLAAELRALRAEVRQLTGVTAAGPAATGRHVGAAIGGAASSASFRSRYPRGGA